MRQSTIRLLVALFTFTIGVATASLWAINRLPSPLGIPPVVILEKVDESVAAKPQTVTDDRDLLLYDFGGRQGCADLPTTQIQHCAASIKKARAFIWEHWEEKKRGYVIVKFGSAAEQSDAHIFVEPDEGGSWHVVWKWERIFALPGVVVGIDNVPDLRAVEHRSAKSSDYRFMVGTTWYLAFLGTDGEEIKYL